MNNKRNTKPRMELIEPSMLEALARALQNGAEKYGVGNYHTIPEEEFFGALLRHYTAMRRGEALDVESGLPHIDHILGNAAILVAKHHHVPRGTFTIGDVAEIIKEEWSDNTNKEEGSTIDSEINSESVTPTPPDVGVNAPYAPPITSGCDCCVHDPRRDGDCGDLPSCQFRQAAE